MSFFNISKPKDLYDKQTRKALLFTTLLQEPLFAMYNLTAFILKKDLKATLFCLTVFAVLKPVINIIAYFWGSYAGFRPNKLKSNLIWANFLGCFLFLFFPVLNSVWFVILASTFFIMFYRAAAPAWIETLKLNIEKDNRQKLFSWISSLGFLLAPILAFFYGKILDQSSSAWKSLFFITAIIALMKVWVIHRLPINNVDFNNIDFSKGSLKEKFILPLKTSIDLIKKDKEFSLFQLGYMLSGFGLLLIQPIIPIYAVDKLNLSHFQNSIAMLFCANISVVVFSPVWGKLLNKMSIMRLSKYLFVTAFLFIIFLIMGSFNVMWYFLAYFVFGITRAGNHILWNMSGPIFSKEKNSLKYSSVNIITLAFRGTLAPILGGILVKFTNPVNVLFLGAFLCLFSGFIIYNKKKAVALN